MSREEIEHLLKDFMAGNLLLDADSLQPSASLKNDLGLTSMDIIDIRLFVERTFGWTMTREDALGLRTLSDLYSVIENHMA